jgi:hypothetical protein
MGRITRRFRPIAKPPAELDVRRLKCISQHLI